MLQYFKIAISSIITAVFSALPFSSTGVFSYLNKILGITEDAQTMSLYLGIMNVTFAITAIIFVRKLYATGIKALTSKNSIKESDKKSYRNMFISILISLVPALLMFIPVSKEKFLGDYLPGYAVSVDMLVTSLGFIFGGILPLIAVWYSKNKTSSHKTSTIRDVVRMSIYNIIPNIFPGFSKVFMASSTLTLSGVNEYVVMRDVLLYIAPSTLLIGIFRIVRAVLSEALIDPIMIAICAVIGLVCNMIVVKVSKKINIRNSFVFFSLLSVAFGIICIATAFILL